MRGDETTSAVETEIPTLPIGGVSLEEVVIAAVLLALLFLLLRKRKSRKHFSVVETDELPPLDLPRSRHYGAGTPTLRIVRGKGATDSTIPKTKRSNGPRRISSAGDAWKDPEPFDAKTSEHGHGHQVVSGTAYVTDGDTIVINKTQIRLFGIDAPELNHPYGQKAKWAMVRLCKGHKIRAEVTDTDHYGRTVARCYLPDGRDLSAELVKQGLAIDWPKFSGGIYTKLELPGIRKKLWLADARQKGRMFVWEKFEARRDC